MNSFFRPWCYAQNSYSQDVLNKVYQDALAEAIAAYPFSEFSTAYPFSNKLPTLLTEKPWS